MRQPLGVSAGHLIARRPRTLCALDARTGKTAWTRPLPDVMQCDLVGSTVYLADPKIVAIGVRKGRIRWTKPLPHRTQFIATEQGIYTLADRGLKMDLTALDQRTGRPKWNTLVPDHSLTLAKYDAMDREARGLPVARDVELYLAQLTSSVVETGVWRRDGPVRRGRPGDRRPDTSERRARRPVAEQ
ncbi:outer membrane protein assembly factor BamB family protein [Wenjunlia tyrosinilytica]|uniref:Pyrrolo-quinoline quinone repeat domain-containing protein n=1 Tax=Wenjunlia tyrosinilytica TaxID=1544741 RepID=A0A917ZTT4_9ACTN|nr:PQQ-binding-like beta-propeller repeat protein [Wenjunlia tyrosinilytica]GGO94728.1 hypothetical protein GCM10012280_50310 [Wenjunlia tyrosinilytica]